MQLIERSVASIRLVVVFLGLAATATAGAAGLGHSDFSVWRPGAGYFYSLDVAGNSIAQPWGLASDKPVVGDFDGDGKSDYAVWRPSNGYWYVIRSSDSQVIIHQWGAPADIPVLGDFDDDGKTDIAVWRPSNGTWYILESGSGEVVTRQWGTAGDVPVPGDYDGDGKTDIAVWRPANGTWYIIQSSNGQSVTRQWGQKGDVPVARDYDGDGKTDIAVWRPGTGTWYGLPSSLGQSVTRQWGQNGDVPVARDFDGDGKADVAVWRPSTGNWYVVKSSDGATLAMQWGAPGDVPINGSSEHLKSTSGSSNDSTPPSTPTGVSVTPASSGVTIVWNAATDNYGVIGYRIYRDGQLLKTVNGLAVTDAGLSPGTTHCYAISAVDSAGNASAQTAQQCVRTPYAGPQLTAPGTSNGSFSLTWTFSWPALASNADGYELQESTASPTTGFSTILATDNLGTADHASPKTYLFTKQPGTYFYRVRANVDGTFTDWSNSATVAVAVASPVSFTVNPIAENALLFSTADQSLQDQNFQSNDVSVGCDWESDDLFADVYQVACGSAALKFDIQSRIAGKTILSAQLTLYPYQIPPDTLTTYSASAFAADWNPSTITDRNAPSFYNADSRATPPTSAAPTIFDVTAILQNWANGTWPNYGFHLGDATRVYEGYTANRISYYYGTGFFDSRAHEPQLYIVYR